ncbi:MAG TPA: ATP-binding protein [Firmicutes bacterium]|nr:ATP-binding protein [Bacillota bacterium]
MLVYEATKLSFIDDVDLGIIADKIRNKYIEVLKRKPSISEYASWKNSMPYMRGVLSDNRIPDNAGIAIEYNLSPTNCRADFMISGYNNETSNIIIVELKQWEKATEVPLMDGIYKVNTYTGKGLREVNHPSYQALTYKSLLEDYNEIVQQKNIKIIPCAYLHNYYFEEDDTLISEHYKKYTSEAPLFGHNDVIKFRDFIKSSITQGDDATILNEIATSDIKPSKMLQDSLAQMLKGNKEFNMIDDQKIIYEYAIRTAINTISSNKKSVMIIKGGPGTGKSVLAINLLIALNTRNLSCFYVTKNSAPRNVYSYKLKGKFTKTYINNLFQSSGNFINTEKDKFDCIIADEAHRLNEKSGRYSNKGENQIKEIINSSKFSIFLIDENQRVTLKDIGREDLIRQFANEMDANISTYELKSQFRCNGSNGYLSWLDRTLEINDTANFDFKGFNYDFRVLDDPNELRKLIETKNKINNKSRIVAGYCWEWPSGDSRKDPNYHEIKMPEKNFEISWNLEDGEYFAIGSNSVHEAGCIHTVQGLEFDYIGVIIGPDMCYENNHIITDYSKRAKSDYSLRGIKEIAKEQGQDVAYKIADEIIKNTYRTLMTRGMKGCYIYCVDKNLSEYIKKSLN